MLVDKDLYAVKKGSPVSVEKYTDFTNSENLVKTTLSSLPRNDHLEDFSLCHVSGNIVLTGGDDAKGSYSAKTYLMAVQTSKWSRESLPDLKQARRQHSSVGIGEQCYVACGVGDGGYLASVEMLRLGAKAWVLIEIPDFTRRVNPIISQIDSQSIAILGGYGGG